MNDHLEQMILPNSRVDDSLHTGYLRFQKNRFSERLGNKEYFGREDNAYDRFIFRSVRAEDYTGDWGVYKEIEDEISDHYLIWAEFWTGKDTD